jgi:hypothetical protein
MTFAGGAKAPDALDSLVSEACRRLETAMRGFKNGLSFTHQQALRDLIRGLAGQALGNRRARVAYALACGGGKTQAVIALISAARALRMPLSFAVSANTIKALCLLKRDLMNAGVPEHAIGLRHGKTASELLDDLQGETLPPEAVVDTGEDDRQIMLVSHSRLRSGRGSPFGYYLGKLRDLVVWDETLFASDAGFLLLRDVHMSASYLLNDPQCGPDLAYFLHRAAQLITEEAQAQAASKGPSTLDLAKDTDLPMAARQARAIRARGSHLQRSAADCALQLLRIAERPVAVSLAGFGSSGEAVIHYRTVVPPELENIAVLDASHAVRILAQLGNVQDGTTDAMRGCKRYDRVKVQQYRMPAGKSTQGADARAAGRVAKQIASIVHDVPADEAILIVMFKDHRRRLQAALAKEGIALNGSGHGGARISVLTWGNETSTNAFGRCRHVILAGVLRRNPNDLAASIAGESDALLHRVSSAELRSVVRSEMAHCVLQAMHRGTCRYVDDEGQAGAMMLHIIDNEAFLRDELLESLPGIQWAMAEAAKPESRMRIAANGILDYLDGLPITRSTVAIGEVKRDVAAGLELKLSKPAWTMAVAQAMSMSATLGGLVRPSRWKRVDRSVVRQL